MKTFRVSLALILVAIGFASSGCVSTSLTANKTAGADLSGLKTFYVEKLPADERNVHQVIADQLTQMGYSASAGTDSTPPAGTDAIVTYQDKWMWDFSMYMIELNIQFRDPKTRFTLVNGKSFRTSLARKSPQGMAAEVLAEIFKQQPPSSP